MAPSLADKAEIVALSKVDAVDEDTLKLQRERLKRAMRTYGPPLKGDDRRAAPLELSAVAHRGVTEVLRIALREAEATKAKAKAEPTAA